MRAARTALVTALLSASSVLSASPADTRPPSRPNSLRITAVGPYSVSLSWNASSDDSGSFSYVIRASNGYTMTVPQTSTTATFNNNLFPRNTYSFTVRAVDGAGNSSQNSNAPRTTLPADTTIPSTPTVTVTDVGAHHVSLSWSSTDNCPYISYFIYINGSQVGHSTTATSNTFYLPQVETAYSVTVKARDLGINFSPTSAPLTVTTEPIDTTDVEAPTTPVAFDSWNYPTDRELNLSWTQSTDNVDPRQAIRYEIYINGDLAEIVIGTGSTTSYGEFGTNLISIVAIDSAGNVSDARTIVVEI